MGVNVSEGCWNGLEYFSKTGNCILKAAPAI